MNKLNTVKKMPTDVLTLSEKEQVQIKGGLLFYCEEKRRSFLGISYTSTQWKMANDGKVWVTVRM